jgi:hypothetical protein
MRWYVRALVKERKPPYSREKQMRTVHADDEQGAKDRFEFLIESEGMKIRSWEAVVQRP